MTEADKFELALYEYMLVLRQIRLKCVRKYGKRANDWFGIK